MNVRPNVGDSVTCAGENDGKVYRTISDNEIRYYPTPQIAASWNSNWGSDIKDIDCTGYTKGADLSYNITEGQSIACSADSPGRYRYTAVGGGQKRGYPNPQIAGSWDPNWNSPMVVDCADFPDGPAMKIKPNVGDSVKCSADSPAILRVMSDNLLRGYPTPEIAATWNSNWSSDIKDIDCTAYTTGEGLGYKDGKPNDLTDAQAQCYLNRYQDLRAAFGYNNIAAAKQHWKDHGKNEGRDFTCDNDPGKQFDTIPEGQSIACSADSPGRYRYTGGQKRGYPNPQIAGSWDPNWNSPMVVDCADFPDGPAMKVKPNVGDSVKCSADSGHILRVMSDNLLRGYPTPEIAASWNSNWSSDIKDIDCTAYTTGEGLGYNITEGQSIACSANSPGRYRYTAVGGGQKRHYPNPQIAGSWDPNWNSPMVVNCAHFADGPAMKVKPNVGDSVTCAGENDGKVYRTISDNEIRHYPNPEIAASWNSNWSSGIKDINCDLYTMGEGLGYKP
jgi:hypothetical protein